MCIGDGCAHFPKKHEPRIDCQPFLITEDGDAIACHVFHRDKRQAISGAAIEQTGDVRMIERCEHITFHHKPPHDAFRIHAALNDLERNLLLEAFT